jgi:hypothetical protein
VEIFTVNRVEVFHSPSPRSLCLAESSGQVYWISAAVSQSAGCHTHSSITALRK